MPPYISPIFNYCNRRSNQFYDHELAELLSPSTLSLDAAHALETPKGSYAFTLNKSEDGKTIALDATLTRGGTVYKTNMTAVQVSENLYEIRQLTFDNRIERTDSRWELTKILAHIGKEQLQKAARNELPQAHEDRGKFGKFARFCDRWLYPEDPYILPPGI